MIAIVKSNFNQEITDALLKACIDCLEEKLISFQLFQVPGAVETVGLSNKLIATNKYAGVIVIGAVIKGDTDHYEYVCDYVVKGHATLAANSPIPIIFGILTTQNEDLALERALPTKMNKGKEFAITAIEMIDLYKSVK
jgi:6,7-dimethyl-8-ribityllumazine synthase